MSPSKPCLVLIEQQKIGTDIFYTTPLFWDCECEEVYIHSFLKQDFRLTVKIRSQTVKNIEFTPVFRSIFKIFGA